MKASKSWLVTMQKINLIAQSVLELSHREKSDDDDDDDDDEDDDEDDTHQGWIIVRDGMYSVADKNWPLTVQHACVHDNRPWRLIAHLFEYNRYEIARNAPSILKEWLRKPHELFCILVIKSQKSMKQITVVTKTSTRTLGFPGLSAFILISVSTPSQHES